MQKISKNTIIIAGSVLAVILIASLAYFAFGRTTPIKLYSTEVKIGEIAQKINLTGQVKASQGVDLSFESQGKIVANYVKVGDKIYTGQALVAIDSSTLQAQLQQAQAQLDAVNIDTVKNKADTGLQSTYAASLSAVQKSATLAKDILLLMSDIQYNRFLGQDLHVPLQDAKTKAIKSLLGKDDAGTWTSQSLSLLNDGAFGLVKLAVSNPTQDNIDTALSSTKIALQDLGDYINAMPIDPALSTSERSAISAAKSTINSEIITTSGNIQAIAMQKVNNSATLTTTDAQVEAAQANINAIKTQISKTVIRALFDGQVDKDNVVVGQLVSPSVPVITISNDNLEIATNIPEISLSGAKIGGDATITLDAFGNGVVFPATIVSIDSAPSVINGVSTYGAKLKFKDPDDRIKTGMTANIIILSEKHSNVLIVPKSAVIQKDGLYFVIVDKGNSEKETKQVNIGLKDDKNIEIISGLTAGEKVLAY